MIISAMKQAIDVLEILPEHGGNAFTRAADALRQAIAEAEKQEPVAWFGDADGFPVYAAPPKREWVGLTDEDVFRLSERIECCKYSICAAEALLKKRNT